MWDANQVKRLLNALPIYITAKVDVIVVPGERKEAESLIKVFEKQLKELAEGIDT